MATGKAVPTECPDRIGKVAARRLALNGYTRYEHLTIVTPKDLLKLHGIDAGRGDDPDVSTGRAGDVRQHRGVNAGPPQGSRL